MKDIILKHALKNALDFQGKVNLNVILGQVLKENPTLRTQVPAVQKAIAATIKDVEKLSLPQLTEKLQKLAPELLQAQEEKIEGPLKPLPNAQQGKVVVRIAPSPSGPLHIGHAYGVCLNAAYAEMYQGKFLLRIEDTNPENIYPQAYELIERDAQWLTNNHVAQTILQSSRLGIYYDYAEKLIQLNKTYVCTCPADVFKELKNNGQACPCRNNTLKENQHRFAKLFNGYAEGEAVVRLKTDISHKNPALRDFGIMRIVEHVHPKTGKEQRVWPLMVFAVAVDDHELGVTHVLNGKDHADNAIKERLIMECLGWQPPEYKHWGRINFEGYELSTSKTRRAIEQHEYHGWEDIRLPFLPALRRRGYQPGAFRKFALEIGLSLNDKTVSIDEFWKNINSFNREIIEPTSNRYFFVENPVPITINGAPSKTATLDLHPDYPQRGQRTIPVASKVFLSQRDVDKLEEGKIHRLMDYCNFKIEKKKYLFVSESYEDYKDNQKKGLIMHWLPQSSALPQIEVTLDNGSTVSGLGEDPLTGLNVGDIVQLERHYFARLDQKTKNQFIFWYLHK
ncbi:TPA: glutamate--tRNA ligase [Candidatus Woesearchaeota archaeon]|nr:glutamate--tRNA ligase [Candidatus Woesearchaeota archaeon]